MRKSIIFLFICMVCACAHLKEAHKLYEAGDYEAAIQFCKSAIARDSTDAEAYFILGQCYRAQGKLNEAVEALERSYQLSAKTTFSAKTKREWMEALMEKADSLFQQQRYYRAIETYEAVLRLEPDNNTCIIKIGDSYRLGGLLDKALIFYQRGLKLDPENERIVEKISEIKSRTEEANKLYAKAKRYLKAKNYQRGLKYLRLALKNKPDHKDAKYDFHITQGLIYYKKGGKSDLWDAIQQFGEAMSLRPQSAEPHYYMAKAYEKKDRNDFDNPVREYQTAMDLEPDGKWAKECRRRIKYLTALKRKLKKFWGK